MKIWEKIFVSSILLFILLFNGAGIVIIETIYNRGLNLVITTGLNEYEGIKNSIYSNMNDFIEIYNIDILEGFLREFVYNSGNSIKNIEIFSESNKKIINISQTEIKEERQEIAEAKLDEEVFIIRDINSRKLLFISSRIRINNLEYKIVLTKDITFISEERLSNYKLFLILTSIVTVLLAIGMYIISRFITNPIKNLIEVSNSIKSGEYNKRAKYSEDDEFGILADNFNSMMQVIEEKIDELEENSNEKQRFIDNLTHEMKTPITSIVGYSELLQKSNISEEIKFKSLQYISSQAKRLEKLSSTLVKLILIKNNEAEKSRFLIKETVLRSISDLRYKIDSKEINIDVNMDYNYVFCEKQLIEVLLSNLLDNAIKASENGKKIRVYGESLKNGEYELKIIDEGIGISKENLKKVKEPFYMVDKSRGVSKNNIGLGLSICNEICIRNNIKLEIYSEENNGTKVVLTFKGDD
ncbi:HAMP domain-containing sensor histidine kinase [Clostridium sp. AL.422]|uniref:sensor histidine kinase n=1 Tax=Clostridium TaxID=1485 RepID=UPI00293DE1BF|nr:MULTISPECIES: HAMP domain-containing sensor histidine kinase [unclassified Clostridium]MDV4151740.1 HAMP domain-containing sensor histidine kinase [Clostridium sp. AL.422]